MLVGTPRLAPHSTFTWHFSAASQAFLLSAARARRSGRGDRGSASSVTTPRPLPPAPTSLGSALEAGCQRQPSRRVLPSSGFPQHLAGVFCSVLIGCPCSESLFATSLPTSYG